MRYWIERWSQLRKKEGEWKASGDLLIQPERLKEQCRATECFVKLGISSNFNIEDLE